MLAHDLKQAWRRWCQAPVVTGVAVLSLTLGVGANTALFSVLNALLLKPLPGTAPEEIVRLRDERRVAPNVRVSTRTWEALRAQQTALAGVAAYASLPINLASPGEPADDAAGLFVSGSYFSVMGIRPTIGRLLTDEDDRAGAPVVGVVSYAFWAGALGSDPKIVGRDLTIARRVVSIVGVSEPGFFGLEVGRTFDVALSLAAHRRLYPKDNFATDPRAYWLQIVGRLSPGLPITEAEAGLRALQPAIATTGAPWVLERASESDFGARGSYRSALVLVFGIAAAVLLVACANVANLLLAHSTAHQRELAVRLSLGARRYQLVRQVLVESCALSGIATALGAILGVAGSGLLVSLFSTFRTRAHLDVSVDTRVLAFTIGISLAVALLCATLPAVKTVKSDPMESLRVLARGGPGRRLLPYTLLAAQVAMVFAMTLVASALIKSLVNLTTADYGFDRNRVVVTHVVYNELLQLPRVQRAVAAWTLHSELERLPGVERAALSMSAPFGAVKFITYIGETKAEVFFGYVSSNYFQVMGLPLVAGSPFTEAQGPQVAVVTETFARKHFGGLDVIGRSFPLRGIGTMPFEIVGVATDIKQDSLRADPPAFVYVPWLPATIPPGNSLRVLLRTAAGDSVGPRAITGAVERVAPGASVDVRFLDQEVASTIVRERAIAVLAAIFGAVALLLAGIGLYGVTWFHVTRRRHEIGIRMAVGATGWRISAMILADIAVVCGAGLVFGAGVAALLTSRIGALLYATSPLRPGILLLTAATILVVAGLASYLPSRHAARLDPVRALRQE